MNNENSALRWLLFGGMLALLVLSFLLDLAIRGLQLRNAEGAGMELLLVVLFPLFELLIVIGGLALFRALLGTSAALRGPAVLCLVVGLLILFGTTLLFVLPVPVAMYALVEFLQPGSYLFQAAAMLAGAGILGVARRKAPG
jgi:hypothetical protein